MVGTIEIGGQDSLNIGRVNRVDAASTQQILLESGSRLLYYL